MGPEPATPAPAAVMGPEPAGAQPLPNPPAPAAAAVPVSPVAVPLSTATPQAPNAVPAIDVSTTASSLFEKAKRLISAGQAASGLDMINEFLALRPADAEVYFWKGLAEESLNDDEAALGSYRRGVEASAGSGTACAELHVNLGNILLRQGHYSDAASEFKSAIAIDPTLSIAHLNLGRTLIFSGDFNGALACFKHCDDLRFEGDQLPYYKAKALIKLGRNDEARAQVSNLLSRLSPQDKKLEMIKQEFAQLLVLP
jgi:tetratricopeptide (TPR) repeat protein